VNAIDIGISAFKTALIIGKYHKVIFIDAIKKGRQAGHVYRIYLHKDQFINKPSLDSFVFSFHESNLANILTTANLLDNFPGEVILIGCEPNDTSTGLGLSKEVMKSIKYIIDLIFHEIQS
jgi:hydrogenase maturation protease